jgi:putative intracellular protease/amidase
MQKKPDRPAMNSRPQTKERAKKRAALLWDESFLWGVMAYTSLKKLGLSFDLVRAEDVRAGCLEDYAFVLVPGGWSSNKMKALGDDGAGAVRAFVKKGGGYLGFCGGAGLATNDGLGLLDVSRKPTPERVPSFSGRIRLSRRRHAIWNGVPGSIFHAWWPPQFGSLDKGITVLARYGKALPDSFSSDLNTGDVALAGNWSDLEQLYKINLDPSRIEGEPAVIEGRYGEGRVILSLVHFDTPEDCSGGSVMENLWACFLNVPAERIRSSRRNRRGPAAENEPSAPLAIAAELEAATAELIDLGLRNFLWFRRSPLLLQWRRGVRGLEYCTLDVMIRQVTVLLKTFADPDEECTVEKSLKKLRRKMLPFVGKARKLLVLERLALQRGPITYERCDDAVIQAMREELFSKSKSYGGRFKELLDDLDRIVYRLLKSRQSN